jgi:MFS transporter, PAT family, beta-lactamase induction signal transducer AmpG
MMFAWWPVHRGVVWWLLPLGFFAGLPLALVGRTLTGGFLTDLGVDLGTVGIFAAVMLPYSLKFLWAPLLDRVEIPWWGRRRGFAVLAQLGIAGVIVAMTRIHVQSDLAAFAGLAVTLSFLAATQDIALDAYRADVLQQDERAAGAGVFVAGYRLGMLVSGALAFVMAESMAWTSVYLWMAALFVVGAVVTTLAPKPNTPPVATFSSGNGVTSFARTPGAALTLCFLLLYKLGDAFAGGLTMRFLKDIGFGNAQVGVLDGAVGIIATIAGGLLAGGVVQKLGLRRALLWCGVLQALTNLGFASLAVVGPQPVVLVIVVISDNIASGLGTAALVAFMMAWCDARFSATQYAMLSSISNAAARVLGAAAGVMAQQLGWMWFFVFTVMMAVPALWLSTKLRMSFNEPHTEPEPAR